MKKQLLAIILLILFFIFCPSCSNSNSNTESYMDENGNFIHESNRGKTVMTSELPIAAPYNEKFVTLTNVSCYQNCTNYSYNLFIVITLDVSTLNDSELHWLRDSDIKVRSYITNDANDYDFDLASSLGNVFLTDKKQLVFVQTSSFFKENRHGFENSDIRTCISVSQEDTYEYKNSDGEISDLNKVEEISYKMTVGDSITDAETIGEPLYGHIVDWLYTKANRIP